DGGGGDRSNPDSRRRPQRGLRAGRVIMEATRYMPALVSVALGFLGVYLLLPQVRRSRPLLGGLAGAAALLLAGWLLVRHETVLPERILFYVFAGLGLGGAGMMLAQSNPVHAALSFALVVLSTCGLFLLLAAPFLMAATII